MGAASSAPDSSPSTSSSKKPPSPSVGTLIDELPLGRFHALHLARLLTINACFAFTLEMNAFVYPGMAMEFHVTPATEVLFAAMFTAGGIFGAISTSLQDAFGRMRVIATAAACATTFGFALQFLQSFGALCAMRFFLGLSFFTTQYGFSAWFTEHLPKTNRGPLYVALTAGYPIGRFGVIVAAWRLENAQWRLILVISACLLLTCLLFALTIYESPRYLAVSGDEPKARKRVHEIYAFNRSALPYGEDEARRLERGEGVGTSTSAPAPTERTPLVLEAGKAGGPNAASASSAAAAASSSSSSAGSASGCMPTASVRLYNALARWRNLFASPPKHLGYAGVLFFGLSAQQQLIQNFGPRVFQRLIYPDDYRAMETVMNPHAPLPFETLALFNFTDWWGILLSVLLIDRLGRRGFFAVGFTIAALLWIVLGAMRPIAHQFNASEEQSYSVQVALVVVGAIASGTRGFAPEAANLWVLETFATDQRATCYATVQMIYQLTSSLVVPLGGQVVSMVDYSPVPLLLSYGVLQALLGVFTWFLPNETANVALADVTRREQGGDSSMQKKGGGGGGESKEDTASKYQALGGPSDVLR